MSHDSHSKPPLLSQQYFRTNSHILDTEVQWPKLRGMTADRQNLPTTRAATPGQPSKPAKITAGTLLQEALNCLTKNSGISDLTHQLTSSLNISEYPFFTGGQADVYCATRSDGVKFAVKCLRQHDSKHVKRTAREISTWSKLRHDYILELSGLAVFRNCLTMVSPWIEHGSVTLAVSRSPGLDRYAMCQQLADAVKYLHWKEVVHGDIKGANVLVASDGTIRLTDFGLAILHNQSLQFSQTSPGGGTARWMAPELFEEAELCYETDVYAMGMTMLEIITGEVPFSEILSYHSLYKEINQNRRIPSVTKLQAEPGSPRAQLMIGVLYRCWIYDPKERASAHQVAALMGLLGNV